jgi:hypothetical protein
MESEQLLLSEIVSRTPACLDATNAENVPYCSRFYSHAKLSDNHWLSFGTPDLARIYFS